MALKLRDFFFIQWHKRVDRKGLPDEIQSPTNYLRVESLTNQYENTGKWAKVLNNQTPHKDEDFNLKSGKVELVV